MKVILFDVMSTLFYDPFYVELPKAFDCSLNELLRGRDRTAWIDFERNEISEEQFFQRFFGERAAIDGPKMASVILNKCRYLEGIEGLLSDLQGRAILATLSNYPIWFDRLVEKLDLQQYMDSMFVSYQLGVRKPDPRAYLKPVQQLSTTADNCLFIDDRLDNCQAANSAGMDAIVFQNAVQLRQELQQRGLL